MNSSKVNSQVCRVSRVCRLSPEKRLGWSNLALPNRLRPPLLLLAANSAFISATSCSYFCCCVASESSTLALAAAASVCLCNCLVHLLDLLFGREGIRIQT